MEASVFHTEIQTDSGEIIICTYQTVSCEGMNGEKRYGIDCFIEGSTASRMTRCTEPDLFPREEEAAALAQRLARGGVFPAQVPELLEDLL